MNLHESGEMYLEAILVLNQKNGFTRSVDVGEYLGYSKPSVSRAMGILRKGGYVLSRLLIELGVSEGTALADACKMEHTISDESFRALKQHYANWMEKKPV